MPGQDLSWAAYNSIDFNGRRHTTSSLSDQSRSYWLTLIFTSNATAEKERPALSSPVPQIYALVLLPLCQQQFLCVQPTTYKRADTTTGFKQDQFPDSHKH